MKSILLFRHGKSDWNAKYEGDHNRPLSKRGIKAAKLMGEYLFNIKQVPEKIISSTAIRAKTTAELALKYGNWNSCLHLNPNIYYCTTHRLKSIIAKQDSNIDFLCLVGHEPTLSSFLYKITGESLNHFPTASMVRIELPLNHWKQIEFGKGLISWFKKPKDLMSLKTTI